MHANRQLEDTSIGVKKVNSALIGPASIVKMVRVGVMFVRIVLAFV